MLVPDLQDGYIILNDDGSNRWWTGIQCVLARRTHGDGDEQRAYLSHECRAESVTEDPFSHTGDYEYVGITTWSGNYAIRSGHKLLGSDPSKPDGAAPSYETIDMPMRVSTADRDVRPAPFDEVLQMLRSDFEGGYRTMHMAITYRQQNHDYTLYVPCRYINFPHPNETTKNYLQPISGYVVYERDERFFIAYVVCHIADGLVKSLQFKLRERVTLGDSSGENAPATHEFCRTERIGGDDVECTFFSY